MNKLLIQFILILFSSYYNFCEPKNSKENFNDFLEKYFSNNLKMNQKSLPIDFKNQTYELDGRVYKFVNGVWGDKEIWAIATLEVVEKTSYTSAKSEYTLYFNGNWGGGNSIWGYVLVVKIENNKIIEIFEYTSLKPVLEDKYIVAINFEWLPSDAHCCPSYEIRDFIGWNGKKFAVLKSDRIKR